MLSSAVSSYLPSTKTRTHDTLGLNPVTCHRSSSPKPSRLLYLPYSQANVLSFAETQILTITQRASCLPSKSLLTLTFYERKDISLTTCFFTWFSQSSLSPPRFRHQQHGRLRCKAHSHELLQQPRQPTSRGVSSTPGTRHCREQYHGSRPAGSPRRGRAEKSTSQIRPAGQVLCEQTLLSLKQKRSEGPHNRECKRRPEIP